MIDFTSDGEFMTSFFNKGAFITAGKARPNTMTASWGFVGVMWRKKVVIVPIRDTRFTKILVDAEGEFTVSIPREGEFKEALAICGTKSGRDVDKAALAHLELAKANKVDTCIVGGCAHYYECKVIACLPLTADVLPKEVADAFYADGNMHNFYFAEVVAEY